MFACLTLVGCQAVNDTLGAVNGALSSVNSVFSGTASSLAVSSATKSSASAALTKARPNSDARQLFNDARPTIEEMISLIACTKDSAIMERFSAPSGGIATSPLYSFTYHDSGCANVLRVNNIVKKAGNSFGFKVYYISLQSEETVTRDYTAIKQADGEWLFRWY